MAVELERYGLPKMRVLTAFVEIEGALGKLLGAASQQVGAAFAGGVTSTDEDAWMGSTGPWTRHGRAFGRHRPRPAAFRLDSVSRRGMAHVRCFLCLSAAGGKI